MVDLVAPTPAAPTPTPDPAPIAPPAPALEAAPSSEAPKPAESLVIENNVLGDAPKPAEPEAPKPAEPPAPIDPASYDIKMPEGFDAADPMVAKFRETAAKAGLQGDAVQAVIDSMAPRMREVAEAPYRAFRDMQTDWQKQISADPEIGGDKTPGVVAGINLAFSKIGNEQEVADLRQALVVTGAGNNPHIVRAFARLSAPFREAGPVTGNPVRVDDKLSPAQKLYRNNP